MNKRRSSTIYCRHAHKELIVSRAYMLKRDYGVEIALQSSGDPFEAPEPDEDETCQRLIEAGEAKNMEARPGDMEIAQHW